MLLGTCIELKIAYEHAQKLAVRVCQIGSHALEFCDSYCILKSMYID